MLPIPLKVTAIYASIKQYITRFGFFFSMTCEHSFSSSVRVSFDIQEVVIKWSRKNPEETGTNCINTRVLTLQTHVLRKTSRLEEAARKLQNLEKRQKLRRAGKCRLRRVKFSFYRYSIRNKILNWSYLYYHSTTEGKVNLFQEMLLGSGSLAMVCIGPICSPAIGPEAADTCIYPGVKKSFLLLGSSK